MSIHTPIRPAEGLSPAEIDAMSPAEMAEAVRRITEETVVLFRRARLSLEVLGVPANFPFDDDPTPTAPVAANQSQHQEQAA